jgi:hypothetical protein
VFAVAKYALAGMENGIMFFPLAIKPSLRIPSKTLELIGTVTNSSTSVKNKRAWPRWDSDILDWD